MAGESGIPNPAHPVGAAQWVLFGVAAALVALSVSVFWPSLIPAKATHAKL